MIMLDRTPKIVSWCERHGLNPSLGEDASTWQDFFEKIIDITDELEEFKRSHEICGPLL